MRTEDNNEPKEQARHDIALMINNHFKDRAISMIELLGSGVGLEYYLLNCRGIKDIVAVELNKSKALHWEQSSWGLPALREKIKGRDVKIELQRKDLYKYFLETDKQWDVINLDFCGWFYSYGKVRNAPGEIIEKLFERRLLRRGGLMFVTFMIDGYSLDCMKGQQKIIQDTQEIKDEIVKIAERFGYGITPSHIAGVYKSSRRTTMMYTGFVVSDT